MTNVLNRKSIHQFIKENKTLFIILIVGLFLIELEIFALAAMKSGRKSWLQVIDEKGNVIHETDGKNLSDFNKYYFEKTFGPFENYDVRLQTKEAPFPFRAWFVAAVGIPVGIVLLFGFIVKAYIALFHGGDKKSGKQKENHRTAYETRLEMILDKVSQMNIFIIGFLIFIGVISYWIIPNMITYIGKTGIETIIRYKWLFLSVLIIVIGVGIWIVYLRYLLAKKSIESRTEVEKHKLQLEYGAVNKTPLQIEGRFKEVDSDSPPHKPR